MERLRALHKNLRARHDINRHVKDPNPICHAVTLTPYPRLPTPCTLKNMQFAVRLVRKTMESILRKGIIPEPPTVVPEDLSSIRTGIYVVAFENPGRKPRGRVGSYLPTKPTLAEEIVHQTVRLVETFPFRKEDLPYLTYELLLTKPPALLATLSELKPGSGLLVRTSQGKQGLSLPGARERTPEERLTEACAQHGINPVIEDARLYEFAVDTITET